MRRRAFLRGLAATLAACRVAEAQVRRIGYLSASVADSGAGLAAFRARLRELGYVEGQNIAFEIRSAHNRLEALTGLATELVQLKVEVIVAAGRGSAEAAQKATTSIPIVMLNAADPVGAGLVESLARPGGNITGLTVQYADVAGKRLQLLKEVVPGLSRVAILVDAVPRDPRYDRARQRPPLPWVSSSRRSTFKALTRGMGPSWRLPEPEQARPWSGARLPFPTAFRSRNSQSSVTYRLWDRRQSMRKAATS